MYTEYNQKPNLSADFGKTGRLHGEFRTVYRLLALALAIQAVLIVLLILGAIT